MTVSSQGVIQAIVKALEEPPVKGRRIRKPVITVSRTSGSGGDYVAERLAEKLGLEIYDSEIINGVAAEANVSTSLMRDMTEKLDAVDAWVYSSVFGKNVSRSEYVRFLSTVVRGLYHAGGVIVGRGGHVILAGRDVLRVRIVGSIEACATRLSEKQGMTYAEAKKEIQASNRRKGKFVWDMFHSRYNDPTNFDLIVNTDYYRRLDDVVEVTLQAVRARGFDRHLTHSPITVK